MNKNTSSYFPCLTSVAANNTTTLHENDLPGGLDSYHYEGVKPSHLISCKFCGLTFAEYGMFNLHLSIFHPQLNESTNQNRVNFLLDGDYSNPNASRVSSPASFKSANSSLLYECPVSPISDIDMLDSYPDDRIVQLDGAHDMSLMSGQSQHSVYLADYALNQEKQLRKIRDDA